jgi:hypothetical protein
MLTPTMSAHPDRTGGCRLLSVLYVRPPNRLFFGGKKLDYNQLGTVVDWPAKIIVGGSTDDRSVLLSSIHLMRCLGIFAAD